MAHRFSVHDTLLHVPLIVRYPEGYSPDIAPEDPVDFRALYRTILDACGVDASEADPEHPAPAVAEYVDPTYTPEASSETFRFEGSRFDRRCAVALDAEHKVVRDDAGETAVYAAAGELDFEREGKQADPEARPDLAAACPDPREWSEEGTAEAVDDEVIHHLESLGYR